MQGLSFFQIRFYSVSGIVCSIIRYKLAILYIISVLFHIKVHVLIYLMKSILLGFR